ncbi:MAG TPA: CHAT domain-containing tetratricopeptide repeat protein [Chloroflexota bacterium]
MLDDVVGRLLEPTDEKERGRRLRAALRAFPAEELLGRLKAESERLRTVDTPAMLRLAEALVQGATLVGAPVHLALGAMAMADALRDLGRYVESIARYDEAAARFVELGDEVGWARTRGGWVWSMHHLGRAEEALPDADRARAVLARHGEWWRAGAIDNNAGWVCFELGRYDDALALLDRAQRAYERIGPAAEAPSARTKINQAMALTMRGDFRTALRLLEEAGEVLVRHGDTINALQVENNVAHIYAHQGHYTRALRQSHDTFAALEQAGEEIVASWAALDIVECYLALNRDSEALAWAEETIARFERCGTPTEAAKARFYCALAHAKLGESALALSLLEQSRRVFEEAGLTAFAGVAVLQRARLHLDAGDWSAAAQEAERAEVSFAERGLVVRQPQARIVRARALLGLDRGPEAADLARSALALAQEHDVQWLAHECHHVLATVARARKDEAQALDEYRAAVESIERTQSRLSTELRVSFLEDKLHVYQDAIDHCLSLGQAAVAFEYLERAKSRALLDYLAGNPGVRVGGHDPASRELADELARLREEHNWLYSRLYGYGLAERVGAPPDDVERLRAAVADLERRIARVLERLHLRQPEGPEGAASRCSYRTVQAALDDETVLLEYYLRPDGGVVFVVSTDGLAVVPLTATPCEIGELLGRWQLNLDATARAIGIGVLLDGLERNARGILESLYRALIEPVEPHLSGRERVVVVPYGPTHAVPFHALHDGRRYLLDRATVSVCPSSALFEICVGRPRSMPRRALVVAHSDDGRLPHVLEEARAVAALVPGETYLEEAATRAALVDAAPRHGVVHLAAHGEARLDNPVFAHVRLADGQLSTADVFNLELDGALVTLSACETGRSMVTGGDELIGLSRGFLHAGASTLVQSLWRVEDRSTACLMRRFYQALGEGRSKGAALREAQLDVRQSGMSHPYFWAPFQLVGDGGPLWPAERAPVAASRSASRV